MQINTYKDCNALFIHDKLRFIELDSGDMDFLGNFLDKYREGKRNFGDHQEAMRYTFEYYQRLLEQKRHLDKILPKNYDVWIREDR